MKIIYNVTIKIENDVHEEWRTWMTEVHIPEVLETNHFLSYKMMKIFEDEDIAGQGHTYAIQYEAPDMETFMQYQKHCAPALQRAHTEKYQGKFVAFRTLMQVTNEG